MDDRVGDLVGISGRSAAGTCHLPHPRRPEQGLSVEKEKNIFRVLESGLPHT